MHSPNNYFDSNFLEENSYVTPHLCQGIPRPVTPRGEMKGTLFLKSFCLPEKGKIVIEEKWGGVEKEGDNDVSEWLNEERRTPTSRVDSHTR